MGTESISEFDFEGFASMSDAEIDLSDVAPINSFTNPKIGKYSDLDYRGYDVRSIANWCLKKAAQNSIKPTNLWLNKLVSLIYERALKDYKILLTPARMEAWEFGPVFRELYHQYPKTSDLVFHRFNVRHRRREVASDPFDTQDLEIFEGAWREYGHLTGSSLTTITHRSGTAWDIVWRGGGDVNPGMVIDIETILGRKAGQSHGRYR